MAEPVSESAPSLLPKRGLLRHVLEPALQLWLKTQVESVEQLQVHLEGGDRQLLGGTLPLLKLEAEKVVYRGLHLSQVTLVGRQICLNIGQLLKGKPLQLLAPVPVALDVCLKAADVQQSLPSDLLQTAILEALQHLVGEQISETLGQPAAAQALQLHNPSLTLLPDRFRFHTQIQDRSSSKTVPIALQTGLGLANPHTLVLHRPEWLPTPQAHRGLLLHDLEGHPFDLGSETSLESLTISETQIRLRGTLTLLP